MLLRSSDGRIACGCRFKHIEPVIDFNYDALASALTKAIDAEAKVSGGKYVTEERDVGSVAMTYDYETLMNEFKEIVGSLMEKDREKYAPYVTQAVEKYLGKGKKISETTLDQAELVYLIVTEIKDEVVNK